MLKSPLIMTSAFLGISTLFILLFILIRAILRTDTSMTVQSIKRIDKQPDPGPTSGSGE